MKHCYSYNFTKPDCKLFKVKRNEFESFDDFLRSPGIRSVIDTGSSEYRLMGKDFEKCEGIETDKAWFKLLHLLFGFIGDNNVKKAILDSIDYQSTRYSNYEEIAKLSLARYIILLRTGEFLWEEGIHEELVDNMSAEELVDLLEEELQMRATIYQHPNSNKIIVEIADYYYDYDALYKEYGTYSKDKSSEACAKYIKYITTSEHTGLLKRKQIMYAQMYGE